MSQRYQRGKEELFFTMASSLSVDGYVTYVSKPKKLRTEKLDDNVLKPDGGTVHVVGQN